MRAFLPLVIAPFLLANAAANAPDDSKVPIPAAIRSMLDAALESGNDGDVSVVVIALPPLVCGQRS